MTGCNLIATLAMGARMPVTDDRTTMDPAQVGTRSGADDDAMVTGPMPVLDLAGGHLHVSIRRDVTLIEVDGGLDDDLAADLAPSVESAMYEAKAVIIDLDRTILLDRTALDAVCAPVIEAKDSCDRCIVSGRLSGRLVLDRWEVPDNFVIFSSVPDALQARAFIESGYGTGWYSSADLAR